VEGPITIRPLLKWAGGKRQLLPQIRRFYPPGFRRYIEPFCGSGAVFFDLYASNRLAGHEVVLIDSNPDLIGCYEVVREHPEAVALALDELAAEHARRGVDCYYDVRDERFNPIRERLRRPDGGIGYTVELAAMLLYLNRTGFNGLFRVNARGAFNVPAGRYLRPAIRRRDQLIAVAGALAGARLVCGSFESAEGIAEGGDFLYCDPPYAPLSRTASFIAYTQPAFTPTNQLRLQQLAIALARRGCLVLLSNSTTPDIAALYESSAESRAAGLLAHRVRARRMINSNASRRGPVDEYLITNIPDSGAD
jgi:DNA adenine methylase